jgi:hypothetical protein
MSLRKILLSLLVAGSITAPAVSQARVDVDINIAPPPPRVEVIPPPRGGYVWAPGYWRWEGHRHVWVPGHWARVRVGYHWVPEHGCREVPAGTS